LLKKLHRFFNSLIYIPKRHDKYTYQLNTMTEHHLYTAHNGIKTFAGFLRYIEEIKELGITRCEFIVKDGTMVYYDARGFRLRSRAMYQPLMIADPSSAAKLERAVFLHMAGQLDFPALCRLAAGAGIENWVIDINRMLCIYYDQAGTKMLTEPITQFNYA
jgi:uncharacterized protein YbcV (DUF1398 family)